MSACATDRAAPASRTARPLLVFLLLASFTFAPLGTRAAEPLPFDLHVQLEYGPERGPMSFLDDLNQEIVAALEAKQCFRSVDPVTPDPADADDLVLHVLIEQVVEQVEWGLSIAARSSSSGPSDREQRQVATVRAAAFVSIETLSDGAVLRSKRFRQTSTHRPLLGEDARSEARLAAVDQLTHQIRRYACKRAPNTWKRDLERARAGSARRAPAR